MREWCKRGNWLDPRWRAEHFGKKNVGRVPWNKGRTKETHPSLLSTSRTVTAQWKTDKELTNRRLKALSIVCSSPDYIRKNMPKGCRYKKIWMRSKWEAAFARWCDARGLKWQYEPQRFRVGERKTYRPDFYLPDQKCWVEIKGYMTEDSREKIVAFRHKFPELHFVWLGKRQLDGLGVLKRAA